MQIANTVLGIVIGFVMGMTAIYLYTQEPTPEVGQGSAQGCILDGTITHKDGSVSNNWVCFDPNE